MLKNKVALISFKSPLAGSGNGVHSVGLSTESNFFKSGAPGCLWGWLKVLARIILDQLYTSYSPNFCLFLAETWHLKCHHHFDKATVRNSVTSLAWQNSSPFLVNKSSLSENDTGDEQSLWLWQQRGSYLKMPAGEKKEMIIHCVCPQSFQCFKGIDGRWYSSSRIQVLSRVRIPGWQ